MSLTMYGCLMCVGVVCVWVVVGRRVVAHPFNRSAWNFNTPAYWTKCAPKHMDTDKDTQPNSQLHTPPHSDARLLDNEMQSVLKINESFVWHLYGVFEILMSSPHRVHSLQNFTAAMWTCNTWEKLRWKYMLMYATCYVCVCWFCMR